MRFIVAGAAAIQEPHSNVSSSQGSSHCTAAASVRHDALCPGAGRIRNREELEQLGGTGLQTQDSLGITHARLAKQKRNEASLLLNQIKDMEVRLRPT